LTDGYLANGSELWKVPDVNEMPEIKPRLVKDNDPTYKPYLRDLETLARSWAIPGQEGLRHRVGGLEKEHISGIVSHDPANHELMTRQRAEKVEKVANYIPAQTIFGKEHSDLLVIGWGGTYGALLTAVKELQEEGHNVSLCQFNYIQPLPKHTGKILANHKKRVVCELNMGQFANYLRSKYPHLDFMQYNKIQGLPFFITELKEKFKEILKEK
jgi:2-oxoglutarate ferredoxin oxidoreductase subunit alpha